jgi:DNA-directed RNA polymerase subunit beta'
VLEDADGRPLDVYYPPERAHIEVDEGQPIKAGSVLAKMPREATGVSDITGGLPRVTEIFEARKPKDPAVMSEISGGVEIHSDKRKGKMTIRVISESGIEKDHHVPNDKTLLVHTGDYVQAGDPLTEGPLVPHDILRIKGEEALWAYMLEEVQNVYRAQGVVINDKHIELILSQMLRKVRIENPGDTEMLRHDVIDKFIFRRTNAETAQKVRITDAGGTDLAVNGLYHRDEVKEANARAEAEGKEPAKGKKARPATGRTLLLGITKASLQSESFLSGASFQETTKVLTEASINGKVDHLIGLKENVIMGRLIPAGTGVPRYSEMELHVEGAEAEGAQEPVPVVAEAIEG